MIDSTAPRRRSRAARRGAILPLYYLRQAGLDVDRDLALRSYTAGPAGDLEVLHALADGAAVTLPHDLLR